MNLPPLREATHVDCMTMRVEKSDTALRSYQLGQQSASAVISNRQDTCVGRRSRCVNGTPFANQCVFLSVATEVVCEPQRLTDRVQVKQERKRCEPTRRPVTIALGHTRTTKG